jgi:hypothetical protein
LKLPDFETGNIKSAVALLSHLVTTGVSDLSRAFRGHSAAYTLSLWSLPPLKRQNPYGPP